MLARPRTPRWLTRTAFLLMLALSAPLAWTAQDSDPQPDAAVDDARRFSGSLTFLYENDVFIKSSDDNYTAGGGLSWISDEVQTYGRKHFASRMSRAFSFLPVIRAPRYTRFVSLTAGLEMYTPTDISTPLPQTDDQPYAGVLFFDGSVSGRGERSMHTYTGRIGCVGPCSGADTIQIQVHEAIGSPIPQGWDHQLQNELLLNLAYVYHRRLARSTRPKRLHYDLAADVGGGLGNYYTGVNTGLVGRFGWRLPDTYIVSSLRTGGANRFVGHPMPGRHWQAFLFVGLQGYGVARFLPTDGNTFRDSPSVERDDLIGNLATGFVVGRGPVVFSWTRNSLGGFRELSDSRAQDFGTLTLTFFFHRGEP